MPRYLVPRVLGDISELDLVAASENATRVRLEQFPDVGHDHTHVVRNPEGGLTAYCVYEAPTPQHVRDHAAAAGLPVDAVLEIEHELEP